MFSTVFCLLKNIRKEGNLKKKLTLLGVLVVSFLFCLVGVAAKEYETYTIGQEIKFNPITGEYCESCDNCYTFNVVNVGENSNYYEMMLNYNLVTNSTWENTTDGPTVAVSELKEATKDWLGVETYISEDNIELPSSSGGYTVNYNGSKARMITADEVASFYNYETFDGSHWVWNGYDIQNNVIPVIDNANRWLRQGMNGNYKSPFGYYTSSASGDNNFVYFVPKFGYALEEDDVPFNDANLVIGLRPVVKMKKVVIGGDDEKSSEAEEVVTTTKKEDTKATTVANPKTSDGIVNIIAIMSLASIGVFLAIKKVKNN